MRPFQGKNIFSTCDGNIQYTNNFICNTQHSKPIMMLLSHIGPRLDEEHEDLASFEELIGFLTLHLDFETTKTVEYCGNKHILCPDSDTSAFVRFVKSEVEQKLKNEREKLNVVIETMISDYQKQIRNSAVCSLRISINEVLY